MNRGQSDWRGSSIASGRYQILQKLGEGGMGFVYLARDTNIDAKVVIKVPREAMLTDPEFVQRFQREFRALVKLRHPHIVSVTDVGEHQGVPYFVIPFLSGGDLDGRLETERSQFQSHTAASVSEWLTPVSRALDFVHLQGYIHRDIKPGNILFDEHGNVFLSDFGIAKVIASKAETAEKVTGTGMVLGTPEYMAPELIMGGDCDGRVDQYALAITAYEALAGRVPISGPTPAAILVNQTRENATPLDEVNTDVSREVADVIARGMARSSDDRFPTCIDFARAFQAAVDGHASVPPKKSSNAKTSASSVAPAPSSGKSPKPAASRAAPVLDPVLRRKLIRVGLSVAGGAAYGALLYGVWAGVSLPAAPSRSATPTSDELVNALPVASESGTGNFTNSLGMGMVCISPGRFQASPGIWRAHSAPYWISTAEVTVAQFTAYLVDVSGSEPEALRRLAAMNLADLPDVHRRNGAPIVGASRVEAEAFCQWLSKRPGETLTYRLPTTDEWLCAYRGGTTTRYFWGDEFDPAFAVHSVGVAGGLSAAGHAPLPAGRKPHPWGLRDIAGNVWEMTTSGPQLELRGGAWNSRSSAELEASSVSADPKPAEIGFRVVGTQPVATPPAGRQPARMQPVGTVRPNASKK